MSLESIPVSVLMSVYNEETSFLKDSIDSILNQTYSNFEYVIVCDNPNNECIVSLLKEYESSDSRVKLYINENNLGLTKSLNIGLKHCSGKYIARMDADDISMPNRLSMQFHYLEENKETDVVFGHVMVFSNNDKSDAQLRTLPINNDELFKSLFYVNVLVHPVAMLRKATLERLSIKYDETKKRSQDYDLWLTMAVKGCIFSTVDEPLLYYRVSENQISQKNKSEQSEDAKRIRIKCFTSYLRDLGVNEGDLLTPKLLHSMFLNLKSKRKWNDADRQLFLMFYYSIDNSLEKYLDILRYGKSRYNFTIRQLLYLLRKPLKKNPSLDINDLLNNRI